MFINVLYHQAMTWFCKFYINYIWSLSKVYILKFCSTLALYSRCYVKSCVIKFWKFVHLEAQKLMTSWILSLYISLFLFLASIIGRYFLNPFFLFHFGVSILKNSLFFLKFPSSIIKVLYFPFSLSIFQMFIFLVYIWQP